MKTRSSRVLRLIREGQFPTVLKVNLADPRVVEAGGACGVDAVWLCNEHIPTDWSNLENMIRAARVHDIDSIVRVSRGSYSDYVRPLEAGATGIIVPHVANADEARQIVEWTRFHPVGKRALDGGNIDGQFCLIPLNDYIHALQHRALRHSPDRVARGAGAGRGHCRRPRFQRPAVWPGRFQPSHRQGRAAR